MLYINRIRVLTVVRVTIYILLGLIILIFTSLYSLLAIRTDNNNKIYYNILNASKGKQSSYIWKSLLEGRNLVKQGLRFEIGKGNLIHCWADPWLHTNPPRAPGKTSSASDNLQVSDLMLSNPNRWNESKVRELVCMEDVPKVLSIKLSPYATIDFLGWHYTKTGIYTVKSAYWLALQRDNYIEPNRPPGDPSMKSKIWKLNTASRLNHFLWKLVSDIVPLGDTLVRRHIVTSVSCKRCQENGESALHTFFTCAFAKSVWSVSGVSMTVVFDDTVDVMTKLDYILDTALKDDSSIDYMLPLWIIWRIRKARNQFLFQNKSSTARDLIIQAKVDSSEWDLICSGSSSQLSRRDGSLKGTSGNTTPFSWYKCNYDGSWVRNQISGGGWTVYDSEGNTIGNGQSSSTLPQSALQAELQALIMAMCYSRTRGFRKMIFEGDNNSIPHLIQGSSLNFEVLNYIRHIKEEMAHFDEVKFWWVGRSFNSQADRLARTARTNS